MPECVGSINKQKKPDQGWLGKRIELNRNSIPQDAGGLIMKRMTQVGIAVLVMLGALSACGKGGSGDTAHNDSKGPRTLQLAHVSVEQSEDMYHYLATNFAKRVEEQTKGGIKVQVLGGAQLGGERDVAEGMQLGTVDMSLLASFTLGSFEKKAMVIDLPYLFKDYQTAFKTLDSSFTDPIEADLEKSGLKILGWGHGGFRNLYNSKQAIRSLSDLSGMKVRTPESPIYVDTWRALGVNVTPMAYPELFTGLQQKTVDGAENPTALFHTSRFYEAAPYLSRTEHVYNAIPLVISGRVWDTLSADEKAIFQQAATQAVQEQRQFLIQSEAQVEKKLLDAGVSINADVDRAQFRKAVAPIYEKYRTVIDPDLVARALALSQ